MLKALKSLIALSISGLKRIKYYILVVTIAFLLGGLLGVFYWNVLGEQLFESMSGIVEEITVNPLYTYAYILSHNLLIVVVIGFLLGVTIITPPLVALFNGLGISSIVVYVQEKLGIPAIISVYSMLPHGVFEIPALIVSTATGVDFGVTLWKKIFKRIEKEEYIHRLKQQLALALTSILLLVVAAAIETSLIILALNIGGGVVESIP